MNYLTQLFLFFLLVVHALGADQLWIEGDYLLWMTKKAPVPVPLVTTASLSDPIPGALGQPGTKILLGDDQVDLKWRNGFRISLGGWTDNCRQYGVEGNFLMLPAKSHRQSVHTSGQPGSLNVAVPIFDVTGLWGLNGVPGETVFILPGPLFGPGFEGTFSLKLSNRVLGSELNALINCISSCKSRVDLIGGIRWVQLEESLSFIGQTAALPNAPFATGFYNFKDSFKTDNHFFGPQVGLKVDYCLDKWLFKGFAKVALGCMDQTVRIKGKSQTSNGNLFYETINTAHEVLPGGVFAQPTNRGTHHRDQFGVLFETGFNITYQFTHCFGIGVGYNFLWLNGVLRPGKQIDRKINPTRTALAQASRESVGVGPDVPVPFGVPAAAPLSRGPDRPKFNAHSTNFWAQGLTVNMNLDF